MAESLLRKLVRNFPENGPKLLLENGANVRDLLMLLREPQVHAIDFAKLTVERSHFVHRDYTHVALDVLLKAPFHVPGAEPARTLLIYLLVEHQSKPQRFFLLRLAEYLLEVYKMQKRAWDATNDSDAHFFLQPVLPVVLYTGERHWEKIETLVDVVEAGPLFAKMIPAFEPHFLNLRDTAPETLVREGGLFGQLLWLIRERNAESAVFRQTLQEVVTQLEKLSEPERTRRTEFLSYIEALVYHARNPEERPELHDVVERSLQTDSHRREWTKMSQTIAEMYLEQGREQGRLEGENKGKQKGALEAVRETLLRQLRKRFKKVPRKVEARIAATTNKQELDTWLENFATAATLADVGIPLA